MRSLYVYTVQIRLVDIIKNSENNKKFYINYSFEDINTWILKFH